tara:strand:- start:504 stop:728 length:225 start_codon:yes stop_codon:yes gene_type:complete
MAYKGPTVTLNGVQVDIIMRQELTDRIHQFTDDLVARIDGSSLIGIFDHDLEKDIELIQKHIYALDLIYSYYSP